MLFFMFIQTTNLSEVFQIRYFDKCVDCMAGWYSAHCGYFSGYTVGNVFILDVDVEPNLMPGVHSGMLLFDAYFRNIWWLKLYLNNQFLANANICRCVLCKKHLVLCVCALFKFRWASVKWFRGKFKFFNITGGFNTKHSCSHEALSLRPSHSISTTKLFYRSKNNVSFHTSAFLAKAFWRAIHIHL